MRQKDLQLLKKSELLQIAVRLKVRGLHAMKKESLVKAILAAERDLKKQDKNPVQKTTKKRRPSPMKARHPAQKDTEQPMDKTEEKPKTEPGPALPPSYNETYIHAMLNNPYCIYCYWEVAPEKIDEVKRKFGDGATVLRIYDISGVEFNGSNANYYLEIEIEGIADRYIDQREPNKTYCMEIGLKTADIFHCLARSNHITTPRITMSERVDANWPIQADTAEQMYALSGGFAMELPGSLSHYESSYLSEGPEQKE